MIYIALKGQLGNQLFQVATYYELKKKFDVALDFQWFLDRSKSPEILKILPNLDVHKNNIEYIADVENTFLSRIKKHYLRKQTHYIEDQTKYNDLNVLLENWGNKDFYLDGYWQSYKYFENSLNEIQELFYPRTNYEKDKEGLHDKMGNFRLCSVHIRRGDYSKDKNMECLNIQYFNMRITEYLRNNSKSKIIVFSDDIKYCRDNILGNNSIAFCDWNKTALQDLQTMACCEDHILSNSSFSYWGALLGRNVDSKIYYPKTWFQFAKDADLSFMFPPSWICVK